MTLVDPSLFAVLWGALMGALVMAWPYVFVVLSLVGAILAACCIYTLFTVFPIIWSWLSELGLFSLAALAWNLWWLDGGGPTLKFAIAVLITIVAPFWWFVTRQARLDHTMTNEEFEKAIAAKIRETRP